jgi:hypothetical protein
MELALQNAQNVHHILITQNIIKIRYMTNACSNATTDNINMMVLFNVYIVTGVVKLAKLALTTVLDVKINQALLIIYMIPILKINAWLSALKDIMVIKHQINALNAIANAKPVQMLEMDPVVNAKWMKII